MIALSAKIPLVPRLLTAERAGDVLTPQVLDDAQAAGWLKPCCAKGPISFFALRDVRAVEKRMIAGEYPHAEEGWRISLHHESAHFVQSGEAVCGARTSSAEEWIEDDGYRYRCRVCRGWVRKHRPELVGEAVVR